MSSASSAKQNSSKPDMQVSFERLKELSRQSPYPSETLRRQLLENLKRSIRDFELPLLAALQQDFGSRSPAESRLIELVPLFGEIKHALKHLSKWMRPSRRSVHITSLPARAKVVYQPKGLVGVISPWNYPVFLSLGPIVGAIAAGNRVMLKVSEFCPATNEVLTKILTSAFDNDWVQVIEGEAEVANKFSQLAFDHLLFTGSTNVGRMVMKNAAENLTPVTLELGGKSPLLMTPSADIEDAANKLVFAKLLNAGQTCVAPDYVLCHEAQKEKLIEQIKLAVKRLYPQGIASPDYTSIINERQLARLQGYLEQAKKAGADCENVMPQGPETLDGKLAMHVLHQMEDDLEVMQDEIFGPILPIKTYLKLSEAYQFIKQRPRPLAMYLFTQNTADDTVCEQQVVSGGLVINHALIHVAQPDLPFGGIGDSGLGAYHAEEGFRTFSHQKAVLRKSGWNGLVLITPPYKGKIHQLIERFWPYF
ncbi:coniferyl aldehyde dehydrogenase [Marinomonas sp. THO17]|uniref:coniferyl aldehyde dehydrogenase n=1 Tax=Marinomonas sp. THO17 TaxID=3149048 RepID=UPI00336BD58E